MKASARTLTLYRNFRGWLALVLAVLLLAFFLLNHALKPRQVARLLLDRAGSALGLELTASDDAEYQLLGTPALVLNDLVAREPGAGTPLLRVKRLYLSLPWSTIRARGADLTATRIELETPVLDLPALQHWLATRPPSTKRLPTLRQGLQIRDGSIVNGDWRIDRIQADLPELAAARPMHTRLRGRYLAPPLAIPVDLAVTIVRPGALVDAKTTGFATAGSINIEHGNDWQLPATVTLSGPLSFGKDNLRIAPARFGMVARYESGDARLPFALGLYGPLVFDQATWTLAPTGVALRGRNTDASQDPVPTLDAHGSLALGNRLALELDGIIASWPKAWPALPPPLSASTAALPFALRYNGSPDLSQVAALQLRRDTTKFDGRFRLQDMTTWIAQDTGNRLPLPPLDGTVSTPRIDIAGAQLEGVQVTLDDPDVPDAAN